MYWFVGKKPQTETRENIYIITMVSRKPRQIVGFDVAFDKSPRRIQRIVDNGPQAKKYCTDGWSGYIDVIYPGKHIRNTHDKSDTFTKVLCKKAGNAARSAGSICGRLQSIRCRKRQIPAISSDPRSAFLCVRFLVVSAFGHSPAHNGSGQKAQKMIE